MYNCKKIWEATRKEGDALDLDANISCKCCKNYKTWKQNHPEDSHKLNEHALIPFHYRVYPNKTVKVTEAEREVTYVGTIHSINCSNTALTHGKHPYQCSFCFSLLNKNSSLVRKFNRSKTLKHPRSDSSRATKIGVTHKYCSLDSIESALQVKSMQTKMEKQKSEKLNTKIEKILNDSWHKNNAVAPFLQSLHSLIVDKKLSSFDLSFITNWAAKKSKGQFCRADVQARSLAVL